MSQSGGLVRAAILHPLSIGAGVLALSALGWAVLFVTASESARRSVESVVVERRLAGMPVLEAFRDDGRVGMHLQWGTPVLLMVPLVVVVLLATLLTRKQR